MHQYDLSLKMEIDRDSSLLLGKARATHKKLKRSSRIDDTINDVIHKNSLSDDDWKIFIGLVGSLDSGAFAVAGS